MKGLRLQAKCLALILGCGELLLFATASSAVPMWARRYGVPCSTCHAWPSQQLTSTGLDFFRRGHRFKGDGFDKDLTHLLSAHVEWEWDYQEHQDNPFNSPVFHFHAGGALTSMFSGYLDANVNNDIESAYLQYTREQGDDVYFTARGGRFVPTLIRNYGSGLLTGPSNPLILGSTVVDANPFTPTRPSLGVDVGGRWQALFVQTGVLNGEDVAGQASVGHHKDFYATGEIALPDGISGIGLYYFRGGYDLGDPAAAPLVFDSYDRTGIFANWTRDRFRVAGAFLTGKDHLTAIADRKIHGYFVQLDGHPSSWWAPFLRYDDTTTRLETGSDHIQQGTVGVSFQLYGGDVQSARLAVEASRRRELGADTNSGIVNLLWIF